MRLGVYNGREDVSEKTTEQKEGQLIKNTKTERWIGLIVGLVLNAAGNGLCIVGAMGSGLWTAAAINLNDWQGWNIGAVLFTFGVINALTNLVLIHHWDWPRLIGEVIYTLFFSSFVNVFTSVFTWLGLGSWSVLARIFVSCFGVFCFCVAISLYQRANIIMHPNDDTTNILRFMYFKGNATASQITNFIPPIIVAVVAWIATGKLLGINVATLFSFLGNGIIIAWADEHVWPQLKHNFKVTPGRQA